MHDPGAALLGGVAGHAGLFGNAMDVAKLMQMYLNKGVWNGNRILDSNIVKDFAACHYCPDNRRGLCFEKPEPDDKKDSPVISDEIYDSLMNVMRPNRLKRAAAVATNPKTGQVLALISLPSFDNNLFAQGISNQTTLRLFLIRTIRCLTVLSPGHIRPAPLSNP